MEPGHEDREDAVRRYPDFAIEKPQWSPVTKTGKTCRIDGKVYKVDWPQWSPVTKTGKT